MTNDANTGSSRHIQLRNNSSECNRLYGFIAESLQHLPVTEEFRHDLNLVAEELLANIINHAYAETATGTIDIELTVEEQRVRITFTDFGIAFNPLKDQETDLPNDYSYGGMGIRLVKSLTDEQSYKRDNNVNVFTVTKNYNK